MLFGSHQQRLPLFKAEVFAGEGAHGANIHHIGGVRVVELFARKGLNPAFFTPTRNHQLVGVGHFVAETHTARAENAALLVQHHQRADIDHFVLFDFGNRRAVGLETIVPIIILQATFPSLIADRAVDRVIEQQELHHTLAHFFDRVGIDHDLQALGGGGAAGNLGHHTTRAFDLDQTHAAIARHTQTGMVTIMGNGDSHRGSGLDQVLSGFDFVFNCVDDDFGHGLRRAS